MNYTELKAALQDWLQDFGDEFVAALPTIIAQAEDRIYRAVRVPALRKSALVTGAAASELLPLPADWRAFASVAVIDAAAGGTLALLLAKDPTFIIEVFPGTTYGKPRFYAVFDGGSVLLGPIPDQSYQYNLQYWFTPESIVTAGTCWIGENAESVLFYACLAEAYIYMKGEGDMATKYRAQYDEAVALLNAQGSMARSDDFRVPAA